MTHKFKVGDRVRYNDKCVINTWVGLMGTVLGYKDKMVLCDFTEHKHSDIAKYSLNGEHPEHEYKLDLVEQQMQDKVLIKPEDYHTLKKDDEVEITVKGFLTGDRTSVYGFSIKANKAEAFIHEHGAGFNPNIETTVYKLTPKATKLEVGEIITRPSTLSTGWKVLHINKASIGYKESLTLLNIDNDISFNTNSRDMASHEVFSAHTTYERKSGIPIDWEATFS